MKSLFERISANADELRIVRVKNTVKYIKIKINLGSNT